MTVGGQTADVEGRGGVDYSSDDLQDFLGYSFVDFDLMSWSGLKSLRRDGTHFPLKMAILHLQFLCSRFNYAY